MLPTPPAGSTILGEGDSLSAFRLAPLMDTWAWNRLTGAHYGWPERLGDWVFCNRPDLRWSVRNGAIGGSTIADVLARFDRHVAPLKPAVVALTIGANDANRNVSPADFARDLSTFCVRLRDLCGGRVVHLGGSGDVPGAEGRFAKPAFVALAAAAKEAVEDHGGVAVDLFGTLARKAAILREQWSGHGVFHDGTHLNPVGHEIASTLALRALGVVALPGDPG